MATPAVTLTESDIQYAYLPLQGLGMLEPGIHAPFPFHSHPIFFSLLSTILLPP